MTTLCSKLNIVRTITPTITTLIVAPLLSCSAIIPANIAVSFVVFQTGHLFVGLFVVVRSIRASFVAHPAQEMAKWDEENEDNHGFEQAELLFSILICAVSITIFLHKNEHWQWIIAHWNIDLAWLFSSNLIVDLYANTSFCELS